MFNIITERDSVLLRSEGDTSPTKTDLKLKKMSLTRPNIQLPSPVSPEETKEAPVKPARSDKVNWLLSLTLTHFSLENPKRVIGKECRPRSDATKCGV